MALAGVVSGTMFLPPSTSTTLAEDSSPSAKEKTAADLAAEIEKLKTLLPDQAHTMADVGYHVSHALCAGEAKNWALAKFYVSETGSHIGWAVRIKASIDQQDAPKFREAYQATLTRRNREKEDSMRAERWSCSFSRWCNG